MAIEPTLQNQVKIEESPPKLNMQIITSTGIEPEIFVYQQLLEQDELGCYLTEFCNVASLSDLDNFPSGAPESGKNMFRLDNICLEFDSLKEVFNAYEKIKKDIDCLLCAKKNQALFEENCFIDMHSAENC